MIQVTMLTMKLRIACSERLWIKTITCFQLLLVDNGIIGLNIFVRTTGFGCQLRFFSPF